jgi:serine/threonine protein kinase
VYLGKHGDTGFEYAMKEFFVKNPEDAVKVKNEVETIRKLPSSPYVLKYYRPVESAQSVFILMEYCKGGSLQEFIQKLPSDQPLEEEVLSIFNFQLLFNQKLL